MRYVASVYISLVCFSFFYDNVKRHKKKKGLNLNSRHLIVMKAEQDINIWRCIYSFM